jgi:predicted DNA-binding transcriptional regulator AlpA
MKINNSQNNDRLLRVNQIIHPIGPIPVSKSTWWAGVKDGRFPKSIKLSPKVTAWKESEILALIDSEER